jgi:hypothetical protein
MAQRNETALARLWHAAAEGLPLPPDCIANVITSTHVPLMLVKVAIWNDHGDTVTALLQLRGWREHWNINWRCMPGRETPLTYAARHGSCHAARSLLQATADVNFENGGAQTPLAVAAEHGHVDFVRLLLDAKAELHAVQATLPVVYAFVGRHVDVVLLLLERKADIVADRHTSLFVQGRWHAALALLEAKGDVNLASEEKCTPLAYAADYGCIAIVQMLLEAKADANEALQHPPVRQMVQKGHDALMQLLLEAEPCSGPVLR